MKETMPQINIGKLSPSVPITVLGPELCPKLTQLRQCLNKKKKKSLIPGDGKKIALGCAGFCWGFCLFGGLFVCCCCFKIVFH